MIYAISDLHLSLFKQKTMDKFGNDWIGHVDKVDKNWRDTITTEDTVLLCGDTSWAMRLEEAMPDLSWIHSLPGRKIIIPGNHDFWWSSTSNLNGLFEDMNFLKNNFFTYADYAICGSRGWLCPNDANFSRSDMKIYKRELLRVRLSMDQAMAAGYNKIILMLHFPPTNDKKEGSGFMDIIKDYPVEKVVYGHLHSNRAFPAGIKGRHDGVDYHLTSADYLQFNPIIIIES